ncbi:Accumulation-associated protein [Labeo rohita]|uniref:Accumulation-associated protein n=1 Tax=Labeo rohita TaxID=84645 RepID=A0ABQ8N1T7_LABRO|nr:Accumulation-associated protein [Labeo rohita]
MDPTVLLILLKQGERSLEDHTRDYLSLSEHSDFPDSSLCKFYFIGLNTTTKALLSGEGPQESLPDYIEWVLASCGSSWTVDIVEKDVSPTQDPEPSQPAPRHAEFEPEPTADDEPEPRATELKIATEPEPYTSDQVREPATSTVTGECNMEQVRAMESPAHCTTAGGELEENSGDLIDFSMEVLENDSGDLIDFFTEISTCHVMHACMESPPTLPLLPMSTSVCSSLPIGPPAPPGSLVFPAPPWSVVVPPSPQDSVPPAAPRHFVPPAPKDSSLPPAQPPSSVAPAPPRTSGSPPTPWSPEPRAPPWPFGSSVSPWIFGSPSPPRAPPPAAPPPSVGPMESSALLPPWLLPPSAPPWVIMAAFWVLLGSSCSGSLLFPPWLLPPSSPPWTLFFLVPLPGFRPPPKPPPTWTLSFCCFFAPLVCFVFCFLRREDAPIRREV